MSLKKKTKKKVITPTEKKDNKVVFENEPPKAGVGKIVLLSLIGAAIVATIVTTIVLLGKNNPKPGPVVETVKFTFTGTNCTAENKGSSWSLDIPKGQPYSISVNANTDFKLGDYESTVTISDLGASGEVDHTSYPLGESKTYGSLCFKNPQKDFTCSITTAESHILTVGDIDEHWAVYAGNGQGGVMEISSITYNPGDEVKFLICSKESGIWSEPTKPDIHLEDIEFNLGEGDDQGVVTFTAPDKDLTLTTDHESDRIGYKITISNSSNCTLTYSRIVSVDTNESTISVLADNRYRAPNPTVRGEVESNIKVYGIDFNYENDYVRTEKDHKTAKLLLKNINADVTVSVVCLLIGPF